MRVISVSLKGARTTAALVRATAVEVTAATVEVRAIVTAAGARVTKEARSGQLQARLERTKGGSTRRGRSESESEEESSERSDSEDSRDRRRRRRRGRDSESESESESRSEVDSEQERRAKKQKEKDRAKAEKEKVDKEKQKEKEKEREKSKRAEEEKKDKETKGKGGKDDSKKASKGNMGDLLDLSNLSALSSPVSQPSLPPGSLPQSPTAASSSTSASSSASTSTVTSPRSTATALSGLTMPSRGQRGQLLNPITSGGLRIDYTFSRKPSLYGKRFVAVDLLYVNESTAAFSGSALSEEDSVNEAASEGMSDVEAMGALGVGQQQSVKLQVDFKGKIQPRVWRVSIGGGGDYAVRLTPEVGELVRPALLSTAEWEAKARRLSGMSEHKLDVAVAGEAERRSMAQLLLAVCNMAVLGGGEGEGEGGLGVLRMSGQRLDDDEWVLLKLVVRSAGGGGRVQCVVHCEDFCLARAWLMRSKRRSANMRRGCERSRCTQVEGSTSLFRQSGRCIVRTDAVDIAANGRTKPLG